MIRWPLPPRVLFKPLLCGGVWRTRCLHSATRPSLRSPPHTEHVQVYCASAGHIILSLHNVTDHPVSSPLIINLPAFPTRNVDDVDGYLPRILHHFPTATIHYRWTDQRGRPDLGPNYEGAAAPLDPSAALSRYIPTPLQWPTPIHDTVFGYEWLIKNLSPRPRLRRRAVYVYGSYLGASLASSLALTESLTHKPMAVRGLLAFNGIYNWSRMLPGHPTNRILLDSAEPGTEVDAGRGSDQDVALMKDLVPSLFRHPSDLFDPFASPVLFFHTAGMLVPSSFDESASYQDPSGDADPLDLPYVYSDPEDPPPPTPYEEDEADPGRKGTGSNSTPSATASGPPAQLRKGYFGFPPRESSLRIPETLLLHSTSTAPLPDLTGTTAGQKWGPSLWGKLKKAENSFEAHALGLANMMRKSVNGVELRERMKWDADMRGWAGEAERRVGVEDVGEILRDEAGRVGEFGLGGKGEEIALRWLADRVG